MRNMVLGDCSPVSKIDIDKSLFVLKKRIPGERCKTKWVCVINSRWASYPDIGGRLKRTDSIWTSDLKDGSNFQRCGKEEQQ